jgi:hypothetical protein
MHRFKHRSRIVSKQERALTKNIINVCVAIHIVNTRAVAALEVERTGRFRSAHAAANTARERMERAFKQLLRVSA